MCNIHLSLYHHVSVHSESVHDPKHVQVILLVELEQQRIQCNERSGSTNAGTA